MEKLIIFIIAICIGLNCKAQSDTTKVYGPIYFEKEVVTSKTGNEHTKYYVYYDNEYYESTKESYIRYYKIRRFDGQPCVVMITSGKTKKKKIIVL